MNGWTHIAALAVSAAMIIGSATWLMSSQIASVRADNTAAISSIVAKEVANEERLNALEKMEAGHYSDDIAFRSEMRTAIGSVLTGLGDLRVDVGRAKR